MNAIVKDAVVTGSPRSTGRLAGFFYLLTVLLSIPILMSGKLVVSGDAAATSTNILAHETLFRAGFVADLLASASYLAVAALFYELFKPVSKRLSRIAACFGLAGSGIAAGTGVLQLAPYLLLKGAQYLDGFRPDQLRALALMFLKLRLAGSEIAFVFFGLYCLQIGFLAFSSNFLPRILGVLMAVAGLCWLTGSLATFLSPELATHLYPGIMAGALGELALTVWLVAMGVNDRRWRERAAAQSLPSLA